MRTIFSAYDLQEALKKEFFAGFFMSERKWYLEKYPLGIFAGECAGRRIAHVQYIPAIPKIPGCLLRGILSYFQQDPDKESVVQILYRDGTFFLNYPNIQRCSKCAVSYTFQMPIGAMLVMTVHSHNTMPAYFSATDDADEKITGLYGVIGRLDGKPQIRCRASLNGFFGAIKVTDLFQ